MGGKKRKKAGKRNRSRRYAVILPYSFVLMMFLFAFGERLWDVAEIRGDIREKEIVLNEVQVRRDRLMEERDISTDPAVLQMEMRRLGYIYPGETVYLGVD